MRRQPRKQSPARETRPVLYLTYAYDDPDRAPVLDVSESLREAREMGNAGKPCYRVERMADGSYAHEQFEEWLA